MLQKLLVSNYALIDKLEIDFKSGFTVITGETGAGKSILLGALGLVIGKRADVSVLSDPAKKCFVEVVFHLDDDRLKPVFEKLSLDFEQDCFLRREINPNGKSRAFINDTPVNLQQLKLIGTQLVDIHAQHDSLLLTDQSYQLSVLDAMLKNPDVLLSYRSKYQYYVQLKNEIQKLKSSLESYEAAFDFISFQLEEFEKAALQPNELEELEQRLNTLTHAEEIKAALFTSNQILQQSDEPLLQQISQLAQQLKRLSNYLPEAIDLNTRIESIHIDLKDISFELARMEDESHFDPQELISCQERLDLINHLMHKHRVQDYKALIETQLELDAKLSKMGFDKDILMNKEKELNKVKTDLQKLAGDLHQKRIEAAIPFERDVTKVLHELGMPHAVFGLKCEQTEKLHPDGQTIVYFQFSANKGVEVADIGKVASGGELSRLMLAVKNKLTDTGMIPTLVFDEIDTGVSGEVAAKLAKVLKQMSLGMQLITITHLPQIASKADHHFHVFKQEENERTQSSIKVLSTDERYQEVAKMLSNDNITPTALKAAKELFKQ
jgi:DNA repair protein RecN (Recombination protein N)